MNPTNIPEPFDQLDALEQNIENTPTPADAVFDDPLDTMLDELERSMEANWSKPLLVPEEPEAIQNTSPGHLSQEQSQDTVLEQGGMDSPQLPYYIEDQQQAAPFHAPPYRQAGRIGRRGGSFSGNWPGRGDETYCPFEKRIVTPDFCEGRDCEYYDEDSDRENGRYCTYHNEEDL
jgi:hypothetical protein